MSRRSKIFDFPGQKSRLCAACQQMAVRCDAVNEKWIERLHLDRAQSYRWRHEIPNILSAVLIDIIWHNEIIKNNVVFQRQRYCMESQLQLQFWTSWIAIEVRSTGSITHFSLFSSFCGRIFLSERIFSAVCRSTSFMCCLGSSPLWLAAPAVEQAVSDET